MSAAHSSIGIDQAPPEPRRPHAVVSLSPTTQGAPWAQSPAVVANAMDVDIEAGLEETVAAERLERFGHNTLRKQRPVSIARVAANQLRSIVIWLLIAAASVSFFLGDAFEAFAIGAAVVLTFAVGFFTELRAFRSMEALRRLGSHATRVRRDGLVRSIEASLLVRGDIVILEGGDRVNADLRLFEASRLQADESILTGESVPVSKHTSTLEPDTLSADRLNMLFKGTSVARGSGGGIVVGTGMNTELGRIASLVEETANERTPLEQQLARLGRTLLWVCLAIALVTGAVGVLGGRDLGLMLTTAVALAVAAIPEGLPIVATIALARGMWRLAQRHALIKKLSAVETLGATNLILVDKTGTLTANQLTAVSFVADDRITTDSANVPPALFEIASLCNNASLSRDSASGDPLEIALLRAATSAGVSLSATNHRWPRVREVAFDPAVKMMATVHREDKAFRVAVKGAAEPVTAAASTVWRSGAFVPLTAAHRSAILELGETLARDGLRILAFAESHTSDVDTNVYDELSLVGLVGFADPPRSDVAAPLAACREAGVRVVMATGDQAATAASIARAVNMTTSEPTITTGDQLIAATVDGELAPALRETDIFARVAPDQKLALVELFQRGGGIVAMTGDGVNDAPALRKAQIGVAMGKRGTDVAREAADMVLVDDSFESIVVAIEQGRAIFENIRRFVVYLLSCNLSEVLIVAGAIVVGAPLPLLPLQILFLNLVTDVFPALALGFGQGSPNAMRRPPRDSSEPIISRKHWGAIALYALAITAATLGAMAIATTTGLDARQATTVSFLTLGFAQLWHVFNLRDVESTLLRNDVTRNPWIWGATILCAVLLVLAIELSPLAQALGTVAIGRVGWATVVAMSLIPFVCGQVVLQLRRRARAARREIESGFKTQGSKPLEQRKHDVPKTNR